jgi:signal transduction histidine kinase
MSAREPAEFHLGKDRRLIELEALKEDHARILERYRAVLDNSSEAIWCCDLDDPIPVTLGEDEQIARMFQSGWLSEANSRMAEMYGFADPAELIGARLADVLVQSDPANTEYLRAFIRSAYRLRNAESHETDRHGEDRYFLNNLTGIVENGFLRRAWGTQRDITAQRQSEQRQHRNDCEQQEALAREQAARLAAEEARDSHQRVEQQVTLLIEASRVLLESLSKSEVLETILRLARRFVAADAYAVWRRDASLRWHIVSSAGLSSQYQQSLVQTPGNWGEPAESFVVENTETSDLPTLPERRNAMHEEGIRSFFSLRLKIRGESSGFITFYFHAPHRPSEGELRVASALANLAATAITTSELYEAQTRLRAVAEVAQQRSEFLSEASTILASSLDYERTLSVVARLAVPRLADWCAVDVVMPDESLRRVAVMHSDPARIKIARDFADRYPPRPTDIIPQVIKTGVAQLVPYIPPESLELVARDAEHLGMLRELGLRSCIIVPLLTRGKAVGAITLVTSESGRSYGEEDVQLAEELARRAATAVDNTQLYAAAQRQTQEAEAALVALRQSNEDLQQFAYVASHDLQEPLRTIASYTQLLSRRYRGKLDESADEFISFIVEAARRMSELIQDLLAYSRAANTPDSRPREVVRMDEVLAAVRTNLTIAVKESGASILAGDLPAVKADPMQMVQLLQNLIANAIKYRGEETPQITIDAQPAGSEWIFAVADNGIGIEPGYAERIFGIFKRLHGSRYPGTGVGLAICKRIVERHGGKIWVESDGFKGSAFKFTLPAA